MIDPITGEPLQEPPQTTLGTFLGSPGMAMAAQAMQNLSALRRGQVPGRNPVEAFQRAQAQNEALMMRKAQILDQQMRTRAELARMMMEQRQLEQGTKRRIVKGADGFNYYADTGERVLPGVEAAEEAAAPFGDSGLRARMFNMVANPDIPWSDPNKRAAAAALSKPTSVMTRTGPQTLPGEDLSMFGYGGAPQGVYGQQPVDLTQAQVDSRGFFRQSVDAHEKLLPLEQAGVAISPEIITTYLDARDSPLINTLLRRVMTPDQRRYLELIMDSGMVKLRDESGAALGKDEIAQQLRQLIVSTDDTEAQRRDKQNRRVLAIDKFFTGGGRWSDREREDYRQAQDVWSSLATEPTVIEAIDEDDAAFNPDNW